MQIEKDWEGICKLPDEVYYSIDSAASQSDLKALLKSYKHYYNAKKGSITTDAMELGKMFHMYVLEPLEFDKTYAVGPQARRNSKEWKAFESENQGKKTIKPDEFQKVKDMYHALEKHKPSSEILNRCTGACSHEQAFFFQGTAESGRKTWCRGKFDALTDDGWLVDLKTMSDADPKGIFWTMKKWMYHVQPAFYCDGLESLDVEIKGFMFVCIETKDNYTPVVYQMGNEFINAGRELYQKGLDKFIDRQPEYADQGYSDKIITLQYPIY